MLTSSASGRVSKLCSAAELEAEIRSANDQERFIGLVAAPLAAAIAILVIGSLIANDTVARLKHGQVDTLHYSLSLYRDLGGVLIALSILMLVTAVWRKRLYLGIVTALYGLAIFNLHYWGFGVPFIMVSAWLLVRAYRLQRDLHEAKDTNRRSSSRRRSRPFTLAAIASDLQQAFRGSDRGSRTNGTIF